MTCIQPLPSGVSCWFLECSSFRIGRKRGGGHREAVMLARYGPASTEQALGGLPGVAAVCRRLDIAGLIDRAPPGRGTARASHWEVAEARLANPLTSPLRL